MSTDLRFFQTGGRINRRAATSTAFVHRDSRWLMDLGLPWSDKDTSDWIERSRRWQDEMFAAMWAYGNGHSYQNFIDPSFGGEDWAKAYYGQNLPRLKEIKRRYDPTNLFRFPQSIPLT